jgi:hypothetical protein
LNEVPSGGWILFKSLKPFPSTPNDTDWFPVDRQDHQPLCEHLLRHGFSILERAPLQLTLVDNEGLNSVHSDKRGGIYYIDCYIAPGADYFIYLDPAKMRKYIVNRDVRGVSVPVLRAPAELAAIMFHNVFPEKTYSVESFYLILYYLKEIGDAGEVDEFVDLVKENCLDYAASANIAITAALHYRNFGNVPDVLKTLGIQLPDATAEGTVFSAQHYLLPYNFSAKTFWCSFFRKLREPLALKSAFVQALHMLNPVFFVGVVRIIWRRMRPGGIYKQM